VNAVAPHPTTIASSIAEIELAGRPVRRVGFGAARLTAGDGWGVPAEPERSRALLRAAIDAGYDYIDTADALGPGVSESIIGETVGDSADVLVSTKVGMLRPGPHAWDVLGHPNYLRQQVHSSLIRLRRSRIDLLFLHRIDPNFPLEDQLGALQDLRAQGLIGQIGVSEPTAEQLEQVLALEPSLAAVQSLYNIAAPGNASIAETLAARGIPFVAYWPLIGRGLTRPHHTALFADLAQIAGPLGLTAPQLALAWIFTTAPNALAIVGSRSAVHLGANAEAAGVRVDASTLQLIADAARTRLDGVTFDPRNPKED